jgi:hypothetical protein
MPYKNPEDQRRVDREYRQRARAEERQVVEKVAKVLRRTPSIRMKERSATTTAGAPLPLPTKKLRDIATPKDGLRIAVIPDAQVRKGVPTEHLKWAGMYLARKQPDVIVCLSDWWDMPSLNRHDPVGSMNRWNRSYRDDVDAGIAAREMFENEIAKAAGYKPKKEETEGNHEDRIDQAILANPNQLYGVISKRDLKREEFGWRVHPFLQPVVIGGVVFCHYFPRGVMGKPVQSPRIQLQHLHMSSFAGHQQGRETAYSRRADGGMLTAIISGSFYQHDEPYMSKLANRHWRGMWMLHEVKDGQFDEMAISINFLKRKFG